MSCTLSYDAESFGEKFSDALIVGHTTSSSSRLWVRVKYPGDYSLILFNKFIKFNPKEISDSPIIEYLKEKGINDYKIYDSSFSYENDLTNVFDVDDLRPSTTYFYAVVASEELNNLKRWRFGYDKPQYFKTMSNNNTKLSFGVMSCHDPFKKGYSSGGGLLDELNEILEEKESDFILACGDQAYVDSTEDDIWLLISENKECLYEEFKNNLSGLNEYCLSLYRSVYRKYWHSPGLRKSFGRYPTYMIWDDHEIMDGWGSYTKDERLEKLDHFLDIWNDEVDQDSPEESREFKEALIKSMFSAARKAYEEYQHSHNPKSKFHDKSDGYQYDYYFEQNNFGFYTLDMRGHHDYEANPEGSRLLGETQFQRFKHWIESEDTKNKDALFIISPVPMVHWHSTFVNSLDVLGAKDDFRDEWDHESNYMERDKILDLVFNLSSLTGKTITFVSGDVHCAGVFNLKRGSNSKANVYQFTSSGITRPPAPGISELLSRDKGCLGYKKDTSKDKITSYEKLCFIANYNFGLIECTKDIDGKTQIWGSIYNGNRNSNIHGLARKRIKLTK